MNNNAYNNNNNHTINNSAGVGEANYGVTSSGADAASQSTTEISPALPLRPTRQPAPSPSSEGADDDDDDDDDDDCQDQSGFQESPLVGMSCSVVVLVIALWEKARTFGDIKS